MDSLTALKTAIQTGSLAYDETQSVNAMLNRKMQRQSPFQVLEYLDKIVCAIIEGANQNLVHENNNNNNTSNDSTSAQLSKVVLDALTTVFKTWQNAALPTFISGACIDSEGNAVSNVGASTIDEVKKLPETLNRVLGVMAQVQSPIVTGNNKKDNKFQEKSVQLAAHYARYIFAQKFVAESATKSLSDQNVRRARFFAQIAGVESYIFISSPLAATASSNNNNNNFSSITSFCAVIPETFVELEFLDALSMTCSANTWLSDLIASAANASAASSSSSVSSSSSSALSKVLPSDFDVETHFLESIKRSLNMVARTLLVAPAATGPADSSSSFARKVYVDSALFSSLPPSLQTRCLIQLAWRGLSRAAPVAVLFRRLHSLGLSSSKPGFLFLTCVGLLTEAPSSQKRDKAIEELEFVYFLRKPSPPFAAEIDLKKEFDAYVKECLAWKGNSAVVSATSVAGSEGGKKAGKNVEMD